MQIPRYWLKDLRLVWLQLGELNMCAHMRKYWGDKKQVFCFDQEQMIIKKKCFFIEL